MVDSARGEDRPKRRLPRAWRITSGQEIRLVMQRGKRSRTAHLDVFASASPAPHPRAGVVVPKHKQSAVRRNRLKRRLREVLRTELLPRLAEGDAHPQIVIRARAEAYNAAFAVLRDELIDWLNRKRWANSSSY